MAPSLCLNVLEATEDVLVEASFIDQTVEYRFRFSTADIVSCTEANQVVVRYTITGVRR